MNERNELRWIRGWLLVLMTACVLRGLAALPLVFELSVAYRGVRYLGITQGPFHDSLREVYASLLHTQAQYPLLFYGSDMLAFGHWAIALALIGPFRDPQKNLGVIQAGILIAVLAIPGVLLAGALRGIPWWWRLLDVSFASGGLLALMMALRLTRRLEEKP